MDTALVSEPFEIGLQVGVVLTAADEGFDGGVERLDSDLELQCAGWELGDPFAQTLGQTVGNHLEMDEQTGTPAIEEEFENGAAGGKMEVEGAVDELELGHAPVQQSLHGGEKAVEWELADGDIE